MLGDLLLDINKELKNLNKLLKFILKFILSLKVLRDKEYNIASNPEYDDYQRGLASMVNKFFDKKSMGSGTAKSSSLILADELHKPVIKKFNKIYIRNLKTIYGGRFSRYAIIK